MVLCLISAESRQVAHDHGIPLIVDEAHGAHFSFGAGNFPESALQCGADLVIQSLHKTLPSLTQTAILHLQGERGQPRPPGAVPSDVSEQQSVVCVYGGDGAVYF